MNTELNNDEECQYMNEILECDDCGCNVKRKDLHWEGGSYYGMCESCWKVKFHYDCAPIKRNNKKNK